jgi:hypothetical protein
MMLNRLSDAIVNDLEAFIAQTAEYWMMANLIRCNSYGVEIYVAECPNSTDFGDTDSAGLLFGETLPNAKHGVDWYQENAHRKNLISAETGLDSHEAVRLWQGLLVQLEGGYPYGGAIIDVRYGLLIGTSGFEEDEDILFSRTIRHRIAMLMDREGSAALIDARRRGQREGELGADRFTQLSAGFLLGADQPAGT